MGVVEDARKQEETSRETAEAVRSIDFVVVAVAAGDTVAAAAAVVVVVAHCNAATVLSARPQLGTSAREARTFLHSSFI